MEEETLYAIVVHSTHNTTSRLNYVFTSVFHVSFFSIIPEDFNERDVQRLADRLKSKPR